MQRVTPLPANANRVPVGGQSVVVLLGPMVGGWISNPSSSSDQGGIYPPEPIYIDPTGPAELFETATCVAIQPGQSWFAPAGLTTDVYVNAKTGGHSFHAVLVQPATNPPLPVPGSFPPSGPSGLLEVIPSYLYQEYQDDDSLQAFVLAFNARVQEDVDWFNTIELPVYTSPTINGTLLDWVAQGLYGMSRPSLSSGRGAYVGPLNTYALNGIAYNQVELVGPTDITVTTDDVFKRILTWHLYKGDGKLFNVRWLKRRIERFLFGADGTDPPVITTYPVSVMFGLKNQMTISLAQGRTKVISGTWYNGFVLNGEAFNDLKIEFTPGGDPPLAQIFKEAVGSGVLELPFQFDWEVVV